MYIRVEKLNSSYAFSLLESGEIGDCVEIVPIEDFNWDEAEKELNRSGLVDVESAAIAVETMKKKSIPSVIANKDGKLVTNLYGLQRAFYPHKVDIKKDKECKEAASGDMS